MLAVRFLLTCIPSKHSAHSLWGPSDVARKACTGCQDPDIAHLAFVHSCGSTFQLLVELCSSVASQGGSCRMSRRVRSSPACRPPRKRQGRPTAPHPALLRRHGQPLSNPFVHIKRAYPSRKQGDVASVTRRKWTVIRRLFPVRACGAGTPETNTSPLSPLFSFI